MTLQKIFLFTTCWLVMLGGDLVFGQEGIAYVKENRWQMGVQAGTFLPRSVLGVTDSYPVWGAWLSHPSSISQIEYAFNAFNAKGVTWYNGALSFRIDFKAYETTDGYLRIGADLNYYKKLATTSEEEPFELRTGAHMGFGMVQEVMGPVFLRADFKLALNPGKSLYVGLGLIYIFDEAGKEATP